MINFDDVTNQNKTEHNPNWPYFPDHPYRTLIRGSPGSGKTNALLNLINNQPNIDKMYLYAKEPYEAKYQYLINKCQNVDLKHYDDPKLLLNTQRVCKMLIKMLKNTIQEKIIKYQRFWLYDSWYD